MIRRLVAVVAGVALAAGLSAGLVQVVPLRFALAVGTGIGAGVFLVVDGSAGAGEGWVYHQVRPRSQRIGDFQWSAGAGIVVGLLLAGVGHAVELGRIGTGALVVVVTLIAANLVFLYRRPNYEEMLEETN